MATKFERDCLKVSEQTGIEVEFYPNEKGSGCFEDDGYLHIIKSHIRAVFSVIDDDAVTQNNRTRKVLTALGMTKSITDSVMVAEEDEDEDDYCSHCGRGGY